MALPIVILLSVSLYKVFSVISPYVQKEIYSITGPPIYWNKMRPTSVSSIDRNISADEYKMLQLKVQTTGKKLEGIDRSMMHKYLNQLNSLPKSTKGFASLVAYGADCWNGGHRRYDANRPVCWSCGNRH